MGPHDGASPPVETGIGYPQAPPALWPVAHLVAFPAHRTREKEQAATAMAAIEPRQRSRRRGAVVCGGGCAGATSTAERGPRRSIPRRTTCASGCALSDLAAGKWIDPDAGADPTAGVRRRVAEEHGRRRPRASRASTRRCARTSSRSGAPRRFRAPPTPTCGRWSTSASKRKRFARRWA